MARRPYRPPPWRLLAAGFLFSLLPGAAAVASDGREAGTVAAAGLSWQVVNDDVMGGRSRSEVEARDGLLRFSGTLSFENNGGFASIRSRGIAPLDFAGASGVQLRLRGDGRRYQLRAYAGARHLGREVAYVAEFEAPAGEWRTLEIRFDAMRPRFRGTPLQGPSIDPARIDGLGLLIADKQTAPFELQVDWIAALR